MLPHGGKPEVTRDSYAYQVAALELERDRQYEKFSAASVRGDSWAIDHHLREARKMGRFLDGLHEQFKKEYPNG